MTEAETLEWHPLRMEYVVYFYDPLWQAMWGRSGEADSYLSIGTKPFPIKSGQRILVEGLIQPVKGMVVSEPKVTVLAESAPIEILSTQGAVGDTQRFNKRMVTVEGYVNRQAARDANHQELELVVEGQTVLAQFLLRTGEVVPHLNGTLVRVTGVYFARNEPTWTTPKLEIWVPGIQSIKELGQIDRDESFKLPATPISRLSVAAPNKLVRLAGAVVAQSAGKSLTIQDETGTVTFPTAQTQLIELQGRVEVIGFPQQQGGAMMIAQAIYRRELGLITRLDEIFNVSDERKYDVHRIQCEFVIYYYDPEWKVIWGRAGERGTYLKLGDYPASIKAGQNVLISGLIVPANTVQIDEPKFTILAESVPLSAVATRGQINRTDLFDKQLTTVEGYVERQAFAAGPNHLQIDLVTEGRAVTVWLLLEHAVAVPQLEGKFVRVKGVYAATNDPTGAAPKIEVWVSGNRELEIIGQLDRDSRFESPVTPIEKVSAMAPDQWVHVAGVVRMQQPGQSLTIRDATGQLVLRTAQTLPMPLGEQVEAFGYATQEGTEWQLRESLFRRAKMTLPSLAPEQTAILRLAEQVRELPPEEVERGHPVQLSGIVTWANPAADFFFIHDSSGGVCVFQPPVRSDKIMVGTKVDVVGTAGAGKFTPVVFASSTVAFSRMEEPVAKQVTLEQALTGVEDSQWISLSGYLRGVTHDGAWARLELTTAAGDFTAQLPWNEQYAQLRGSVLRLRGVCSVLTNAKRQLTGIQLWVPSGSFLEIEEKNFADPFAVATKTITSLRQFNSLLTANRRVRLTGVVVHHLPGRVIHLQEGAESLLVLSQELTPFVPGDRVEAVGFPGREGSRVILREAVCRKIATGEEPVPVAISVVAPIDLELDGRLVRLPALLLNPGRQSENDRLILQANNVIFEAQFDAHDVAAKAGWKAGSQVRLTGVYQVQFDEYKRPHNVQLQLRTPQDVQVLSRPSWLTTGRVMFATGILIVVLVLGFGWVLALRRRVRLQTGQIRVQVESEKAARLEAALARASKLESLGVLAGGIAHDFNNLLTVVLGNLSLVSLDPKIESESLECLKESERAAMRARDLTQQLITFAKGGEPVRAVTLLPEVVREATQFALHGSNVRCDYEIGPTIWPADVDKGQIGQVIHNLIINASHAMPHGGVIRIAIRNEEVTHGFRAELSPGRYLRLTIADSGTGISAEHLTRIFEPYFTTKAKGNGLGLATVFSIIKKHQGHLEVESVLGVGTTFHIWLPASATIPAAIAEEKPAPPKMIRVLFMDDEISIRQLGAGIFKRMGVACTVVADGAAVLQEYETARAEGRPYALVMLDLTVPGGMGGAEAMEKLLQINPAVKAIVSSGYSSDPIMANFRAYGFCGMVAKPYDISIFMKTVSEVLPGSVK